MLLLQGISASLSLSLSSMFKQDMDWWMTFQAKLSPEACSTVTAMHLPLSLLAFQKLVDRIIQAIKKRRELWKTPKTSFQMPSLCILHHWWLLFYFQYIQTHLPFRNRHIPISCCCDRRRPSCNVQYLGDPSMEGVDPKGWNCCSCLRYNQQRCGSEVFPIQKQGIKQSHAKSLGH